jgi:cytidine deaminase
MTTLKSLVWTPSSDEFISQRKWIIDESRAVGIDMLSKLAQEAAKARASGYQVYSGYKVGAALLDHSGVITLGANIEIASYSETGHAEEAAAKNAVLGGAIKRSGRKFIRAIAISHEGNTGPCGRCRQILTEFCDNALVVVANPKGVIRRITSMEVLLPYAFKPSDLGKK